jgi:hypothetical protein
VDRIPDVCGSRPPHTNAITCPVHLTDAVAEHDDGSCVRTDASSRATARSRSGAAPGSSSGCSRRSGPLSPGLSTTRQLLRKATDTVAVTSKTCLGTSDIDGNTRRSTVAAAAVVASSVRAVPVDAPFTCDLSHRDGCTS